MIKKTKKTNHKIFIFYAVLTLLFPTLSTGQQITISGTIRDAKTGEMLISANIYNPETYAGVVSNVYGFYSLKLPAGRNVVMASFIGYQTFEQELYLLKDTVINIRLSPVIELQEVVVLETAPQQSIASTETSTIRLSPVTTKKIPLILGEADLIKTLQLMPGVQGGTEGSSGFYVRGGGSDQNLVLLDGVPVYNVSHLFGFMSVFNPDAIRNVTLIKGGFPARYGGRLSSVLDIRMKEGNNQEFKGEGGIGVISSNLTLEGPIIKDKTSFMVSGRRSYFDIFTYPFQDKDMLVGYFLQDFNAKINHIINDRHKLYLSFYTGKDKFFFKIDRKTPWESEMGLQWGNITTALRWNYIITNKLFCNVSATMSNFKFSFFQDYNDMEENSYYEYYSHIRDYAVKFDFDYIPDYQHNIKFGGGAIRHSFSPGVTISRQSFSDDLPKNNKIGVTDLAAYEYSAYIEDDFILTDKIKINAGLHFSAFNVQNNNYTSIEPRISGRYMILHNLSLKLSYVKMQQYLHLLANSTFGLPTDLWVPATKNVKPQQAQQVSLGLSYSPTNEYEFGIEGYYKKIKNMIDYIEGASFFDLSYGEWEKIVTKGYGDCYGVEFLIQKPTGKLTGWLGYTLSWADRYFDEINFGKKYPYRYDARHDFAITAVYSIKKNIDCGVVWVYRTGYPFTLENEKFLSMGAAFLGQKYYESPETVKYFETRNNYRMPDYHRLDVGFNFHKQKRKHSRTWSFGMYNAYGRNNPFFVYPDTVHDYSGGGYNEEFRLAQVSIFNFIPYVKWSLKF